MLELRSRGDDFMLLVGGRVLMTSMLHASEVRLGEVGCEPIRHRKAARVLTAGLGFGFTLRAILDSVGQDAHVCVAELNGIVIEFGRGAVAHLSKNALDDPRVQVVQGDVMDVLRKGRDGDLDAFVIDLYVGPGFASDEVAALYGPRALKAVHEKLRTGGIYAVWGEQLEPSFVAKLERAGFETKAVVAKSMGRRHVVYVAKKI